jgi:hypothetical protein
MLDDDISRVIRFVGPNKTMQAITGDDLVETLEKTAIMARDLGTVLFGLNIVPDRAAYPQYAPISLKNVILGPVTGIVLPCPLRYDETLSPKEDYDFYLQALNKYRRVLRLNDHAYICGHLDNLGGLQFVRTSTSEREKFEALRRKWGSGIVRSGRSKASAMETKMKKKRSGDDASPIVVVPIQGV